MTGLPPRASLRPAAAANRRSTWNKTLRSTARRAYDRQPPHVCSTTVPVRRRQPYGPPCSPPLAPTTYGDAPATAGQDPAGRWTAWPPPGTSTRGRGARSRTTSANPSPASGPLLGPKGGRARSPASRRLDVTPLTQPLVPRGTLGELNAGTGGRRSGRPVRPTSPTCLSVSPPPPGHADARIGGPPPPSDRQPPRPGAGLAASTRLFHVERQQPPPRPSDAPTAAGSTRAKHTSVRFTLGRRTSACCTSPSFPSALLAPHLQHAPLDASTLCRHRADALPAHQPARVGDRSPRPSGTPRAIAAGDTATSAPWTAAPASRHPPPTTPPGRPRPTNHVGSTEPPTTVLPARPSPRPTGDRPSAAPHLTARRSPRTSARQSVTSGSGRRARCG